MDWSGVESALGCRDGSNSVYVSEPRSGIDGIAVDGPGGTQSK
jgi:hypothetical protein